MILFVSRIFRQMPRMPAPMRRQNGRVLCILSALSSVLPFSAVFRKPALSVFLLPLGLTLILLTACQKKSPEEDGFEVDDIVPLLPRIRERELWARDIYDALIELKLPRSLDNVCAVVAVIGQESNFQADPPVAGVSRILKARLDKLNENFFMRTALNLRLNQMMSDGRKTFRQGIDSLHTERDVEIWYKDFTAATLTQPVLKLLGKSIDDLITTAGSMQVSVDYARQVADQLGKDASHIRQDIYERKWGVFYGTAHLLWYDAPYKQMKYRFADFNAGHYASRNAAFQQVLAQLAKRKISLDGDLLLYRGDKGQVSEGVKLAREIVRRHGLALSDRRIDADFAREKARDFEETETYRQLLALYQAQTGKEAAYARMPEIRLKSDKISRQLTTEWFAGRVSNRFEACKRRDRSE